jgi:putative PIN family toxin of toxin-antitoxin system
MRFVLDTDVMVAALRSPTGASAEIVRQVIGGRHTALASVPLFLEYEAVMTRAEHLAAAGGSAQQVRNLLDVIAGVVEPVEIRYLWRPQLPDADDDMVLECAVNGSARYLATFNIEDFQPKAVHFGVLVLTPRQLLKEIRS